MTNREIQRKELAGKTKLTAITIGHRDRRLQIFCMLWHNADGEAVLPMEVLNKALDAIGCNPRGRTYYFL